MTLSIPDAVAHRFQTAVPARRRSRLVTRLLEHELAKQDDSLAAACRAANRDRALVRETADWQAFEDGIIEPLDRDKLYEICRAVATILEIR